MHKSIFTTINLKVITLIIKKFNLQKCSLLIEINLLSEDPRLMRAVLPKWYRDSKLRGPAASCPHGPATDQSPSQSSLFHVETTVPGAHQHLKQYQYTGAKKIRLLA